MQIHVRMKECTALLLHYHSLLLNTNMKKILIIIYSHLPRMYLKLISNYENLPISTKLQKLQLLPPWQQFTNLKRKQTKKIEDRTIKYRGHWQNATSNHVDHVCLSSSSCLHWTIGSIITTTTTSPTPATTSSCETFR